jgi:hypothetical protein
MAPAHLAAKFGKGSSRSFRYLPGWSSWSFGPPSPSSPSISQRSVSEQGRPSQRRYPRMSHFDHMSADPEKNGTNFVNEKSADAGVVVRGVDSPEGTVHRECTPRDIYLWCMLSEHRHATQATSRPATFSAPLISSRKCSPRSAEYTN